MIWKIIRPTFWILDRRFKQTPRYVVIGAILFLLFIGQWLISNFLPGITSELRGDGAVAVAAAFIPFAFFGLILFSLLGLDDIIRRLYQEPDLKLLLTAPIPIRWVFGTILLGSARAPLIPAIFIGVFFLLFGLARRAEPAYFIWVLTILSAAVLAITSITLTLVLTVARVLPPIKLRSWLPFVFAGIVLLFALGQHPLSSWLLTNEVFLSETANVLQNPDRIAFVSGVVLVSAALLLGLSYWLFSSTFLEGYSRFKVSTGRRFKSEKLDRGLLWNLAGVLPKRFRHIFHKEWLVLRRNPTAVLSFLLPYVMAVIILFPLFELRAEDHPLRPMLYWLILMFSAVVLVTLPTGAPLFSLLEEGRNIEFLRSSPVSMSNVLGGKFLATWLPLLVSWMSIILLLGLWLPLSWQQLTLLLGTIGWSLTGTTLITMAVGARQINFSAPVLKQRLTSITNYTILGLNLLFVILTIVCTSWILVRIAPGSLIVQLLFSLEGFFLTEFILFNDVALGLLLLLLQVTFWAMAGTLWKSAVVRLEKRDGT